MKNCSDKNKRLAIICGGTGGHFFPGLTIARTFQNINGNKACLFVGGHKTDNQIINANKYGIEIREVESGKLSKNPLKLFVFMIKLVQGYLQGKKYLKEFKPDAVLAMGSFTSVPISLAAVSLKIPLFLHDGNAKVGRANRFLSRWARLIMTAFPPVNQDRLKCKHVCTGMPLRQEILNSSFNKANAIQELNKKYDCSFHANIPTILVFGGSQGAATINRVIPKTIPNLKEKVQIIHLSGKDDIEQIKKTYARSGINSITMENSDEMSLLYSAADIVICRSGGSTIAELAFFEKPAILIPYPLASDLHQDYNARFYASSGLAKIIQNKDCSEQKMKELIELYIQKLKDNSLKSKANPKKPEATNEIIKLLELAE